MSNYMTTTTFLRSHSRTETQLNTTKLKSIFEGTDTQTLKSFSN